MTIREITQNEKETFDAVVKHPLQTYEWGEFRQKTGVKVIRRGIFKNETLVSGFQLTIHKIPHTPWTIGYLPKGELPNDAILEELQKIGEKEKCIFIQLEPNVHIIPVNTGIQEHEVKNVDPRVPTSPQAPTGRGKPEDDKMKKLGLKLAAHPLFTKYTFMLDLTKSENELLAGMHSKTRYNIKVAQKHGVEVIEDNSTEAFKQYLELTEETTRRQKFYAHTRRYHELQWQTFPHTQDTNQLTSHLFVAKYQNKILTTMLFFVFKDTLYYPYGASSDEFRNVMHSTLTMWEAIRFGKKLSLKKFDMWGALGPNPDPKDPWFGFHNFKEKYDPEHVEFIGSYDLVINPLLYQGYKVADKLRWLLLKIKI